MKIRISFLAILSLRHPDGDTKELAEYTDFQFGGNVRVSRNMGSSM